jgi:hypothetical protein
LLVPNDAVLVAFQIAGRAHRACLKIWLNSSLPLDSIVEG